MVGTTQALDSHWTAVFIAHSLSRSRPPNWPAFEQEAAGASLGQIPPRINQRQRFWNSAAVKRNRQPSEGSGTQILLCHLWVGLAKLSLHLEP